jgi:hypothetical protein
MAQLVGCSEIAIKRIEYGTLHPSFELVERISAKTGCALRHSDGHWGVAFKSIVELEYDREFFESWQSMMAENVDGFTSNNLVARMLGDVTQVFLETVRKSEKTGELYAKFGKALYRVILESDIASAFLEELRKRSDQHNELGVANCILLPFGRGMKFPINVVREQPDATIHRLAALLFTAGRLHWFMGTIERQKKQWEASKPQASQPT